MRLLPLSLSGVLFLCAFSFSQKLSAAQDLGTLGGVYSFARDINRHGDVAGESSDEKGETHAFLWSDGIMTDLGTYARDRYSMANGMNDRGQVVGYSRPSANQGLSQAVLWEKGKVMLLPPLRKREYSQASEINEGGEIVGVSGTQAVLWRGGKPEALPGLGGGYSIALGINNKRQIVGNCQTTDFQVHACAWRAGRVVDLGTLGGRFSTANAINDAGQIVGSSETADRKVHAFVYENGIMRDLGPGMIRNTNSLGVFAGEKPGDNEDITTALLWNHESFMTTTRLPGTVYSSAFAINDAAVAAGVSEIRSHTDESSQFHATLWDDYSSISDIEPPSTKRF